MDKDGNNNFVLVIILIYTDSMEIKVLMFITEKSTGSDVIIIGIFYYGTKRMKRRNIMFVLQTDLLHCDVLRTFWRNCRMVDQKKFPQGKIKKMFPLNSFNYSSSWHLLPSFPCSQQRIHQTWGLLCHP